MEIREKIKKDVAVVSLQGNFLCEVDQFKLRQRLKNFLDVGVKQVVIDLEGLNCIDSLGLGTLISALTTLRRAGGDVKLACVGGIVDKLLKITRLTSIFGTFETVEDALDSYKGTSSQTSRNINHSTLPV